MKYSYFQNKPRFYFIVFSIAAASLAVRLLMGYQFHNSALLYVGIPFAIALLLILVRSPSEAVSWKKAYLNKLIDAFIIMLGSSIVLFEGFVCVVMFMPIYLLVILVTFISAAYVHKEKQKGRNSLKVHVLPVLLLLSSFEGVGSQVSLQRYEQVSATRVVKSGIGDIKANLQKPIDLQTSRPWFLHLFPMPYSIESGSLSAGDIHKIHFRYHRWFVTNTHEGTMLLEMTEVGDKRIRTTFLQDTSYFSNYLVLKGTEILLEEIDQRQTRVTLRIDFERKLDPYWYFSPVERYGVAKTAEFLITEVIAREPG